MQAAGELVGKELVGKELVGKETDAVHECEHGVAANIPPTIKVVGALEVACCR